MWTDRQSTPLVAQILNCYWLWLTRLHHCYAYHFFFVVLRKLCMIQADNNSSSQFFFLYIFFYILSKWPLHDNKPAKLVIHSLYRLQLHRYKDFTMVMEF